MNASRSRARARCGAEVPPRRTWWTWCARPRWRTTRSNARTWSSAGRPVRSFACFVCASCRRRWPVATRGPKPAFARPWPTTTARRSWDWPIDWPGRPGCSTVVDRAASTGPKARRGPTASSTRRHSPLAAARQSCSATSSPSECWVYPETSRSKVRPECGENVSVEVGVARRGEGNRDGHADGEDHQHQGDDHQRRATGVVAHEGELDHARRDDVGQQRPFEDLGEGGPGEILQLDQQRYRRDEQGRPETEQRERHLARRHPRRVRGQQDAADDDQAERARAQPRHRWVRPVERVRRRRRVLETHWVATLVMITNVAICMRPVMPAVTMKRFMS